jgi:hypothetical protein
MSIVFTPISLYLCIELIRPCEPSKHVYLFFGPLGDLSITSFLQEPQPIDWEYYRKGIGSKVVDMYKVAYESKHGFFSPS